MICLDTHAWYWWVAEPDKLPDGLGRRLEREPVAISSISVWEVAQQVVSGRIKLRAPLMEFLTAACEWEGLTVVEIGPSIAVRAARLGPLFPSDPADRLITATALELRAALVTADSQISASGVVDVLWD